MNDINLNTPFNTLNEEDNIEEIPDPHAYYAKRNADIDYEGACISLRDYAWRNNFSPSEIISCLQSYKDNHIQCRPELPAIEFKCKPLDEMISYHKAIFDIESDVLYRIKDDFAYNKIIPTTPYLSDHAEEIIKIITENYYTFLSAPTGTGKTTFVMEQLTRLTKKIIFLTPKVTQVQQLREKDGTKCYCNANFNFLHGKSSIVEPHKQGFVATYDQLDKIINVYLQGKIDDYIIVIDEVHKLYTDGNFRTKAIESIIRKSFKQKDNEIDSSGRFKKVIAMSATYEMNLLKELLKFATKGRYLNISVFIDFHIPKEHKKCNIVILSPSEKKSKTISLYDFVQYLIRCKKKKGAHGKIIMVRRNNKEDLKTISFYLKKKGYKSQIINSDNQKLEQVSNIICNEFIPDDIDFLLSTSLIDEGVNIFNENIHSVHFYDNDFVHVDDITQCVGRFRNALPEIFIYRPFLSEAPSKHAEVDELDELMDIYSVNSISQQSLATQCENMMNNIMYNGQVFL